MEEGASTPQFRLTRLGWIWLGLLLVLFAAGWIVGKFDHSTQITPSHDDALQISLVAAIVVAIVSAAIIFWQSAGSLYRRLVMSLVVAPMFSILGVFILLGEATTLITQNKEFPPETTRTFDGLLMIGRAYQTHGKGRSWNIQTTPIWSNLDVTEDDYTFMLTHRAPSDSGHDPDEISSHGYFCAKVTLQQAGASLRVMHSGTFKLPRGTVGICSDLTAKYPSLPALH